VNPNVLDTLPGEAFGGGIGVLGAGPASVASSASGTPQGTVQWPLLGTVASPVHPPPPVYSTIQQPLALAHAPLPLSTGRSRRSTPWRVRPHPGTARPVHS
jgi:hypothetical protein